MLIQTRSCRIASSSTLSLILGVALSPFLLLLKKLQIFLLVLFLLPSKKSKIESKMYPCSSLPLPFSAPVSRNAERTQLTCEAMGVRKLGASK